MFGSPIIIIINTITIKSSITGRRKKKTVTPSTRKVRKLSPVRKQLLSMDVPIYDLPTTMAVVVVKERRSNRKLLQLWQ